MGVHVARFKTGGEVRWGVVRQERLTPLPGTYATLASFLETGAAEARRVAAAPAGETLAVGDVELLSPVTAPCNVVCQGQNYRDHMREVGQNPDAKTFNQIFRKASSSLTSSRADILKPERVKLLDYEIELGLVIGRPLTGATRVERSRLHEYVAGLVICNDVSARDIQLLEGQWHKSKSFRTFCPAGPYLYLLDAEDSARVLNLRLQLSVNGQSRQDAHTSEMIYPPEETLTELSEVMDLLPGDLVMTGTPHGVAAGQNAPKNAQLIRRVLTAVMSEKALAQLVVKMQLRNTAYLKEGDVVRATISSPDGAIHLGTQENRVVAAGRATS